MESLRTGIGTAGKTLLLCGLVLASRAWAADGPTGGEATTPEPAAASKTAETQAPAQAAAPPTQTPSEKTETKAEKEARWKLAEYEQHESSALSPQDLWAKIGLLLNVQREEEAIDSLHQLVARQGAFPDAHMLLAQMLLKYGDERGLQHLVKATQQRADLADTAAELGYDYLMSRGRKSEAMRFAQRIAVLLDR